MDASRAQGTPQAEAGRDDPRVRREQVALLFESLKPAAIADAVLALALAAFFFHQTGRWQVLLWYGLHVAQTARMPVLLRYFKDPQAGERSRHWARVGARELGWNSLAWALAPWLLLPPGDQTLTLLLVIFVLTICSAGALSVAPVRPAIYSFMVPMIVGLATALAGHGSGLTLFIAACCPIYLAVSVRMALQQHDLLTRTLELRFRQEDLALRLAEQIEATRRASEEKARFLAAASHDLRQPVHAIALFGAVLEKELRGQRAHANALRLMSGVNALGTSLDTMLDVSRLDAGTVEVERRPVPLNPLLRNLHQMFAGRAEERGLQLRLRATPLAVVSDPDLLQRLLANLVENAIKYTPQGGVVIVARRRGSQVCIDVHDTGIGIEPRHLDRVFDEYYQVDNPGRDRSKGLGMGLAIVRRLAYLLGHGVEVVSRPGRGSRFRVVLPEASAAPEAMPARAEAPGERPAMPRRVLLLDDEVDIGHAVRALLGAHGIETTVVQHEPQAEAAVDGARSDGRPYEALLCDYRLAGGVDGLDAALRLRARAGGTLRVLIVTGETSPERLQRVRESGLPVLYKPASAEALLAALGDVASGREAR